MLRAREKRAVTHFRRRLSWTMQSTLSQRQFPQGNCSTTSHRTLRALQDAHARGARRLVTLLALSALSFVSAVEPFRFLACASAVDEMESFLAFAVVSFASVTLSASVSTDSEREWNSASLFAIVYGGGSFCRRGHFLQVYRFAEVVAYSMVRNSYVQRSPGSEWPRTSF